MTLTEFLLARIAEDEVEARAATRGPWFANNESVATAVEVEGRVDGEHVVHASFERNGERNCRHIARQHPARVLAECEAKRRIMGLATFSDSDRSAVDFWLEPEQRGLTPPGFTAAMIGALQALAAVYADHPDYQQEWKP